MNLPHIFTKPHHDDEYVDGITVDVEPRYKTSGLSGDEWRVSAVMQFWRKGRVVFERRFGTMEVAAMAMPWFWKTWMEQDFKGLPGWDEDRCFQPGCFDRAVVEVELKEEFSERGEGPLPQSTLKHRRKFCAKHSVRGDCGREDSDSNYIKIADIPSEPEISRAAESDGKLEDYNQPNPRLAGPENAPLNSSSEKSPLGVGNNGETNG